MFTGQLSFNFYNFFLCIFGISVGSLYSLESLFSLLCDIYLLRVSSAASHVLLEVLWWDCYLPDILWISVEMQMNLLLCVTHKFQELLDNVYFRCLVCITWMRKQPTYHEIELLCFLLVSSSFCNARLTQVCLRDCWLHRLCWATVLETLWHIIIFNGDHILYCLQGSLCCFLNLVLKSRVCQMPDNIYHIHVPTYIYRNSLERKLISHSNSLAHSPKLVCKCEKLGVL